MRNLYDYICESAAMGNLGIDFETFCDLVEDPFNKDIRKKVSSILKEKYGDKADDLLSILIGWTDNLIVEMSKMGLEIDETIMKFIYDTISKTPIRKLDSLIGHGANAAVIDLGDKVMKCFYRGRIWENERKFYELCKTERYDITPKVYRIGKGYVVLEKLSVGTPKCKRFFKFLESKKKGKTVYQIIQDDEMDKYEWNNQEDDFIWLMVEIKHMLEELNFSYGDFGDLHSGNIGERENGELVYFDI